MATTKAEAPSLIDIRNALQDGIRRAAVRPSISGYRPFPHQIPFHQSKKRGRLFLGGNRAGKTVAGGSETVQRLVGKHLFNEVKRPPIKARAIGVDFEQGIKKIILPEIARWIPPSLLKNGSWEDSYDKQSRTLTLTNESFIEFMSYDQDIQKFAGTSRDWIWFDEEPPEDIFNENMLRLLDVNGFYCLTMTPLIDMSWTYDRLYTRGLSGTDPDIDVFQANTSDNPMINASEIEILLDGMSEEERDARKHGRYFSQSGGIYSQVLSNDNFLDPIIGSDLWPQYYNHWGHFGMLDHGYTNPTAFYLGCYDEEGTVVIYHEYYVSKRLVRENSIAIQEEINKLELTHKVEYIVADPSIRNTQPISGTSIQQEFAEHGLYLSLGNNDVSAGINVVSSRFKNKQLYITKNCEQLIWELQRYRWDKFTSSKIANRRNLKEQPLKKDDHGCDALRYGIVSRPRLENEVDMPMGNVLNAPVAIEGDLIDSYVLEPSNGFENEVFDSILGSDW